MVQGVTISHRTDKCTHACTVAMQGVTVIYRPDKCSPACTVAVQRVTVIYRPDKCSPASTVAVQKVSISYRVKERVMEGNISFGFSYRVRVDQRTPCTCTAMLGRVNFSCSMD